MIRISNAINSSNINNKKLTHPISRIGVKELGLVKIRVRSRVKDWV